MLLYQIITYVVQNITSVSSDSSGDQRSHMILMGLKVSAELFLLEAARDFPCPFLLLETPAFLGSWPPPFTSKVSSCGLSPLIVSHRPLLIPSSTFKDPCNYIGASWKIHVYLTVSWLATSFPLCHVTGHNHNSRDKDMDICVWDSICEDHKLGS